MRVYNHPPSRRRNHSGAPRRNRSVQCRAIEPAANAGAGHMKIS